MGKRDRLKAAKLEGSSSGEDKRNRKSPIEVASNDDDAKEERSKKKMRETNEVEAPRDAGTNEIDAGFKDFCGELFLVDDVKEKEKSVSGSNATELASKSVEVDATVVANAAAETNSVAVSDNAVLRKLLRGPRYFDPPDSSWGACYNCGEEGHTSVNCTSARRKKPCFVCGSFEHNARQCSKGRDCFICKQSGHRAKDCPDRSKSSKLCLKCGDLGHEMFSCRNDYCPDDMKEIQCYICGVYGHLCCKDYGDPGPREVSCYRCGLTGHTGLACSGSRRDTSDRYFADTNAKYSWNTIDIAPPSSCYKCGIVGHFARECTVKSNKRKREPSTPKRKSPKKTRDHLGARSAPHDIGKKPKKKKSKSIQLSTPAKTKHSRGWTTEHPAEHSRSKSKDNRWRSPAMPRNRHARIPYSYGDYGSSSRSPRNPRKINFHDSPSNNGSGRSNWSKHSASRYGQNSSGGSMGRNNNWW